MPDVVIVFITPVVLVVLGTLLARLRRLSWRDDLGFKAPTLGPWVFWTLGFIALATAVELASRLIGMESAAGTWRAKYDASDLLVRIVAVALVYPVAEEFFYRGVLLRIGARRFGANAGILLSAVAFAAAHVQYDWRGMALILVDALFYAVCRVRMGPRYLVMLLHIGGNSYAVWERLHG